MFAIGFFLVVIGIAVGVVMPPAFLIAFIGALLCLKAHPDSMQRMMGFLFVLAVIGGIISVFIA